MTAEDDLLMTHTEINENDLLLRRHAEKRRDEWAKRAPERKVPKLLDGDRDVCALRYGYASQSS